MNFFWIINERPSLCNLMIVEFCGFLLKSLISSWMHNFKENGAIARIRLQKKLLLLLIQRYATRWDYV